MISTTHLSLYKSISFVDKESSPMDSLKSEIDNLRGSDEILLLTNGTFNYKDLSNSSQVGRRNIICITNVSRDEAIERLRDEMSKLNGKFSEMQKQMGWMQDVTVVPNIQNCAAQILLFFLGVQPLDPPPISRSFLNLQKNNNDIYNLLVAMDEAQAITVSPTFIVKIGDNIINRRNCNLHPSNISELDQMVDSSLLAFNIFPTLSTQIKHEFLIIQNYEGFKKNFHSHHP